MTKCYSELIKLKTFEERFEYLKLSGLVGESTFGPERYLNQKFYNSKEWKTLRNKIIIRDDSCDLAIEGLDVFGRVIIHHINPIVVDDFESNMELILNPENLIVVSHETHNAIHYGDSSLLSTSILVDRRPNDTVPWRM